MWCKQVKASYGSGSHRTWRLEAQQGRGVSPEGGAGSGCWRGTEPLTPWLWREQVFQELLPLQECVFSQDSQGDWSRLTLSSCNSPFGVALRGASLV